jgi:hypothetical protein
MSVTSEFVKEAVAIPAAGPDVELLRKAAQLLARTEVADAVTQALNADGRSLRELQRDTGLDPAFVSRLARGEKLQGGTVASLAQIALALDKTLHISIE